MIREYAEVYSRWNLIRLMVDGQLRATVHRTFLGTLWFTVMPILQIAMYYFLIVIIFRRGGHLGYNPFVVITIGIMHFSLLTQSGGFGIPAIYSNASLQMQVKIEPLVLIFSGFYKALRVSAMSFLISLIVYLLVSPNLTYKLLFYPFIIILWIIFCWIVTVILACASVYLRDLPRVVPFLFQLVMYSSPVIYTFSTYPDWLVNYALYSPPATIFSLLQWSLFGTALPAIHHMVVLLIALTAGIFFSNWWYTWARRGFTKAF